MLDKRKRECKILDLEESLANKVLNDVVIDISNEVIVPTESVDNSGEYNIIKEDKISKSDNMIKEEIGKSTSKDPILNKSIKKTKSGKKNNDNRHHEKVPPKKWQGRNLKSSIGANWVKESS
ncbi:hypothetical protein GOM44_07625, partial [Wolbachia endosymbiont of Atemnus politus]|uniref:hypothetical protein n=1 Tax=Wolbachia endosymbiont of Atemnus politus TaxID=2682840 RepID=UPI001573D42B